MNIKRIPESTADYKDVLAVLSLITENDRIAMTDEDRKKVRYLLPQFNKEIGKMAGVDRNSYPDQAIVISSMELSPEEAKSLERILLTRSLINMLNPAEQNMLHNEMAQAKKSDGQKSAQTISNPTNEEIQAWTQSFDSLTASE